MVLANPGEFVKDLVVLAEQTLLVKKKGLQLLSHHFPHSLVQLEEVHFLDVCLPLRLCQLSVVLVEYQVLRSKLGLRVSFRGKVLEVVGELWRRLIHGNNGVIINNN